MPTLVNVNELQMANDAYFADAVTKVNLLMATMPPPPSMIARLWHQMTQMVCFW
jgi:hypothetical protein